MSNNTILKALERMGYGGRMTGHGFRGIASTVLPYLPQRRKMMQWWSDHLDQLRRGAKVIPMKTA